MKNLLWQPKVFLWRVQNGMHCRKRTFLCWMSGTAGWLRNSFFLICSVWTMIIIISICWRFPVVGMVLHSLQKVISGLSFLAQLWVGVSIRKSSWKTLPGWINWSSVWVSVLPVTLPLTLIKQRVPSFRSIIRLGLHLLPVMPLQNLWLRMEP